MVIRFANMCEKNEGLSDFLDLPFQELIPHSAKEIDNFVQKYCCNRSKDAINSCCVI
jgi:hypothetical protein